MFFSTLVCRLVQCARPSRSPREGRAENASGADDLTAIRGIGIANQNRLYSAGIRSYARLAEASPEEIRGILGRGAAGADVEAWIAQARELAQARPAR